MFSFGKKIAVGQELVEAAPNGGLPPVRSPPKLTRVFSENPEHREAQLLEFVTEMNKDRQKVDIEEGLQIILENGVDVLFKALSSDKATAKPFGNKGYFALNSICFTLCSQADGPDNSSVAYKFIVEQMERFIYKEVVALLLDTSVVGLPVVVAFSRAWEANKSMTKWMQLMFQHMDKGYIVNSGESSITCVGMSLFREIGLRDTRERVRSAVLTLVESEREGLLVDRAQLKSCVEVFIVLGLCDRERIRTVPSVAALLKQVQDLTIYTEEFEDEFLASTKAYYEGKAAEWRDDPVPEYLVRAEIALVSERERSDYLLHPSTESALRLTVVDVLLNRCQLELVQRPGSGMRTLLVSGKSEDLRRMFDLFTREGVLEREAPMAVEFEAFCVLEGRKLLGVRSGEVAALEGQGKKEGNAYEGAKLVVSLLELHRRTNAMVSELFGKSVAFQKAFRSAFQVVLNETSASKKHSLVEYLVAYLDGVLKGKDASGEKLDEQAMESRLDETMRLFEYLNDKDLYAELFRDYLAKRLLNNKVASLDMEKHIITSLKVAQGPPFTSKIEGMLTDFSLVEASVAKYTEYISERREVFAGGDGGSGKESGGGGDQGGAGVEAAELARACEARVHVLSGNYWPTHSSIDGLRLAPPMLAATACFERYHAAQQSGKNLLWKHSLGDAEVLASGFKSSAKSASSAGSSQYTVTVTTLQAVALLFVGGLGVGVTAAALAQEHMNVSLEIVKRVMHSLSCGKYKILTKTGPGEKNKIDVNDVFSPNKDFKNKVARFSVPMASLENTAALKEKVKEDRSFVIDAALVRTMKARKHMAHSNLISEVMAQLTQFKPESSVVKRRIASLIERDYLERSEGDHNVYNYLA